MHIPCTETNTISKRTEQASTVNILPRSTIEFAQSDFHARGTLVVYRAPILHRDFNYLQMDRNELPLDPRRLGVQLGMSNIIFEPMISLAQTMYLFASRLTHL
jgi:hypothetical protein